MQKRSVTLAAETAEGVEYFVGEGGAESFSAAINEAAERWVADQRLGAMLEEMHERNPATRPTDTDLARVQRQVEDATARLVANRRGREASA